MRRVLGLWSNPFAAVGAATVLALGASTILAAGQSEDRRQARRFDTWFIDGPACAAWTPPGPAPLGKVFKAGGVAIARQHGHMACFTIQDNGGRGPGRVLACHMLSPGLLEVESPSGTYRFDPGPGGPATVLVDASSTRCVARANTRLVQASSSRAYD